MQNWTRRNTDSGLEAKPLRAQARAGGSGAGRGGGRAAGLRGSAGTPRAGAGGSRACGAESVPSDGFPAFPRGKPEPRSRNRASCGGRRRGGAGTPARPCPARTALPRWLPCSLARAIRAGVRPAQRGCGAAGSGGGCFHVCPLAAGGTLAQWAACW